MEGLENVEFGSAIKEQEFSLKDKCVHLNHGSYGTVPRRVNEHRMKLLKELEELPELWFRRNVRKYWDNSKTPICEFVHIKDPNGMVFVPNATTGTNAVIKSLRYSKGDIILGTTLTYQAVKNLMKYIGETRDEVSARFLEIKLPIKSKDDIVNLYRDFLKNNKNIKIAIIDFITSPSVILMPVKEIIEVCHQHGVLTLIDGAHSPGQVEVNLDELGSDFYVGNLHKWLYAPRGCAILHVAKQHTDKIHALNTSWHLYKNMDSEFLDNGTKDHTPFFCAEAGLNFFQRIGGFEKVNEYNRTLIRKGRDYVMKLWGTDKQDIPDDMEAPFMVNIKLPPLKGVEITTESTFKLQLDLLENQNITTVLVTYLGVNYCRLSCQVYNTMEDYIKLAHAIKELML